VQLAGFAQRDLTNYQVSLLCDAMSAVEMAPESLTMSGWQMRPGERAALEGVLATTSPGIAIELGTYRGGSLRRIAAHHHVVHTFDLTQQVEEAEFENVVFHIGDSHELLPEVLDELHAAGRTVSFALVDGDHSPDGAKRDLVDLLEAPAVSRAAIVLHDTGNAAVCRGLLEIDFAQYSKISGVYMDFVPPLAAEGRLSETWAGLGLITIDDSRSGAGATPEVEIRRRRDMDLAELLIEGRRRARRAAGLALRRAGMHPAQRRPR